MKKVLFSCTMVTILLASLVSCSETNDAKTETSISETRVTTNTKPASEDVKASDYPTFSDETVNQNLAQFNPLKEEYIKALDKRNPKVISDFMTKYSAWAKQAAAWGAKLKPEELPAFNEYMNKLNKEWTEATMKAVNQ